MSKEPIIMYRKPAIWGKVQMIFSVPRELNILIDSNKLYKLTVEEIDITPSAYCEWCGKNDVKNHTLCEGKNARKAKKLLKLEKTNPSKAR